MNPATHWSPDITDEGSFRESFPHTDPMAAAKEWISQQIHLGELDDRAILTGKCRITLVGYVNDPNAPTQVYRGEDGEYFEQPGEDWYAPTGETRTVEVSLAFRLVEAT